MLLSNLLVPAAVRLGATFGSKKRLFQEIADIAESCHGLPAPATVDALLERESLGPTAVGHGVALPHARLNGIASVTGVFLRVEKPMEFTAPDRKPIDLVFALLAPETAGVEHLKALAAVSRTMRNPAICKKLRANSDPATLYAVLTEIGESQAA